MLYIKDLSDYSKPHIEDISDNIDIYRLEELVVKINDLEKEIAEKQEKLEAYKMEYARLLDKFDK